MSVSVPLCKFVVPSMRAPKCKTTAPLSVSAAVVQQKKSFLGSFPAKLAERWANITEPHPEDWQISSSAKTSKTNVVRMWFGSGSEVVRTWFGGGSGAKFCSFGRGSDVVQTWFGIAFGRDFDFGPLHT